MDDEVRDSRLAGYRFGAFDLDARRLELKRDGVLVDVEPKPLEVLVELARHAGEVVTKDDLMESVWGGRPVTDYVLTRCIARLRAALGDTTLTVIANVYGQGYRFTAPVVTYAVIAATRSMHLDIGVGQPVPMRPHWRFERPLDEALGVWLVARDKTGERRVFKFALTPERIPALRREITVHRLLRSTLGEDYAEVIVRMLDFNLEAPPYFLELDWHPHGTLLDWCERQGGAAGVPLELRLEILAQAAEGLARAHAAGVVHLDVKPSNLLIAVDEPARVQVRWADFGCGRVLAPDRLDALGITRLGARTEAAADAGTLAYIAPEVIAGREPTTQSDVYALGVMLYQLLCGDPGRPLTAGWEHDVDDPLLREDVAAAAAGDPARRLGSALELARRLRALPTRRDARAIEQTRQQHSAEIERRLERLRSRRPWILGASAALVVAALASLWGYHQAAVARDEARADAELATGLQRFFSEDVLGAASAFDPTTRGDITMREAMDKAVAGLEAKTMPPLTEAQVRAAIAFSYLQMSQYDAALRENRRAVAIFARMRGADDRMAIQAAAREPEILLYASRFEAALVSLDHLDRALAGRSDLDPELALAVVAMRGAVYFQTGRYPQALPYYRAALDLYRRLHPTEPSGLATRHEMLALTYAHLGQFAPADENIRLARAAAAIEPGPNRATGIALVTERAGVVADLEGRYDEAQRLFRAAHDELAARLGADDVDVAESESHLGLLLSRQGQYDAGARLARHAYGVLRARYGEGSVDVANALVRLGSIESAADDRLQSVSDLRRGYESLCGIVGESAPDAAIAAYEYAAVAVRARSGVARDLVAHLNPDALRLAAPTVPWANQLRDLRREIGAP